MAHVTREDGHLVVAAIRVLAHRDGTPPALDAVAELLGMPPEALRVKLIELQRRGIVAQVESAYALHLEVRDHLALEDLEPEAQTTAIDDELADFDRRKREEADRMAHLFDSGEHDREQGRKLEKMDSGLDAGEFERRRRDRLRRMGDGLFGGGEDGGEDDGGSG